MKRSLMLYPLVIGVFACLIWMVINAGKNLKPKKELTLTSEQIIDKTTKNSNPVSISSTEGMGEQLFHNIKSPLALLLLQIITILFVSKLFGAIFTKMNQPSVVGEMVTGIFLGPSIMGVYASGIF